MSHYVILFAIATGARFSEIIGLTWDCVDDDSITINKTWDNLFTNDFSNTKNYASKRTITIDHKTVSLLKEIQLQQDNNKSINNLVFANNQYAPITNNAVNKMPKSLCKDTEIKSITCHALRHTHGSLLLCKGLNIKYIN
ncbi:site-specific integrase [Listeria booriae]|uniref:site-specific integrase n=1 Tax=Listeria booriae TaxID=1552123 RepID=UPI0035DBED07